MFMTTKMISQSVFFLRFVIVPNWTVWLIFGFMFLFSSCTKKPLGTFFYCEVGWPDESYNPMKEAFSQTFYCQFYHFGFPWGFFWLVFVLYEYFKKLVTKISSLVWLTKKGNLQKVMLTDKKNCASIYSPLLWEYMIFISNANLDTNL